MMSFEISELLLFAAKLFGTIVLVLVSSAAAYLHYIHRQYDHIPGPRRTSFWLGNYGEIRDELKKGLFLQEIMLNFSKRYGHTFLVIFAHRVFVVTVDPDTIKKLLVTDGGYPKDKETYEKFNSLYGARFIGRGLATVLDNATWSSHRSIMNPAFGSKFLMDQMDSFNEVTDQLMQKLSKVANGKTEISMLKEISGVTLDIIGKVAFGMDINSVNEAKPFCQAITTVFQGFSEQTNDPFLEKNPLKMGFRSKIRKAINILRETGEDIVKDRMQALKAGDYMPKDILAYIMQMADRNVTTEVLIDNFVTFFVAGQETTSTMLSFLFLAVGRKPEIYKKMQDEVDAILGERTVVTYDDVGNMEYMGQVIKETLRLYPPVTVVSRETSTRDTIGGYTVPSRTRVMISIYTSQRFGGDLEFNPDKFAKNQVKRNIYSYFPFSLGPRNCIGQSFVKLEARVILAKFLQRFDMKLDPTQSFEILESITLRPKGGVMCSLTLRENVS